MIVLSLRYALLFIASFNYVNGFNKVSLNLTNEIESLASVLKKHDLTIVDSANKRILYFIVNKNENYTQHFRRSDDNHQTDVQVINKLNHIMDAFASAHKSAGTVGDGKRFKDKVLYVDLLMKSSVDATEYLYNELLRIKQTGVVKDSLRKMISFMEMPEYDWVKRKVFKCFIEARKSTWNPPIHYWTHHTNDMTIDIF